MIYLLTHISINHFLISGLFVFTTIYRPETVYKKTIFVITLRLRLRESI